MDIKEEFGTLTMGLRHKPHNSITKRLDEGDHPLNKNKAFLYHGYLGAKEFKRCHDMLEAKLPYEFSLSTAELNTKLQLITLEYLISSSAWKNLTRNNWKKLQLRRSEIYIISLRQLILKH